MTASSRLRIVVTGLIAHHAQFGGAGWDYLQYPLGLARLGHDVYYLEDSGEGTDAEPGGNWNDEAAAQDPTASVLHLASVMARFGLGERWLYRFPAKPHWYGIPHRLRREVIAGADLLINVGGTLKRPEDYREIPRLAYIDTDPVFTQIKMQLPRRQLKLKRRVAAHDVHFTFGERLAGDPATPYRWHPTRQPVVLSEWEGTRSSGQALTSVLGWPQVPPISFGGRSYGQEDVEVSRFVDTPRRAPSVRFQVALGGGRTGRWETAGGSGTPIALLRRNGWWIVDAAQACATLDGYRTFIQSSRAEWAVARNGYVAGQAGCLSGRSACYLAAGRPVVLQDTGLRDVLPTGEGLVVFGTPEESTAAVEDVVAGYDRHARAAREIAGEWFDSDRVLASLIDVAMNGH